MGNSHNGYCPFQAEKFLEKTCNLKNFLQLFCETSNTINLSWNSHTLSISCELLELTPAGLKKNVLPTLKRLGLIKKTSKNWDYVTLTEIGEELVKTEDIENFEESLRRIIREFVFSDSNGKTFIERVKRLVELWGEVYWWEIWFASILDVPFETVLKDISQIRKKFNLKKKALVPKRLKEITDYFKEFSLTKRQYPNLPLIKGKNTLDIDNLINRISTSWGIRLSHFGFSVKNSGYDFSISSIYDRKQPKVKRQLKLNPASVKHKPHNYDLHHIVSHVLGNYNPELHSLIENPLNGLLIHKSDHNKIPKKNNTFIKLRFINGKIFLECVENSSNRIQIDFDQHINQDELKIMTEFNNNLLKKLDL